MRQRANEKEPRVYLLRIEHHIPSYNDWKTAFDNDPIGREKSGVRRHRIMRATDDPDYVMIDLEFDGLAEAERVLAALRELWGAVQPQGLIGGPQARIVETVEDRAY
jgi:hypothetical protein